ncbi:MAG TPA: glycosyltransferase family 4 protein [Longimicrobiales bacterium]|nr:glycosyltransferase family 4 protein [Longimicrobiales bacterium]
MRIAILTETYAPVVGGGETQARLLAEGLAERGHAVAVVTRRTSRALSRRETVAGVRVVRLGPSLHHHLAKWALGAVVPMGAGRLLRAADAVLVSGFRVLGIPARALSAFGGAPVVLKADNNGELSGAFFDRGLARLGLAADGALVKMALGARNRLLRGAAAWVALSADIEAEYRAHGVPPERIHRIPNGFDPTRFRPAGPGERARLRRDLALPPEARVVAYTGRLVSYKGLPGLLRAWRPIAETRPDALLLIVGAQGLDIHGCERDLRDFVARQGLARNVRFTGAVSGVERYLRAADGFVLPSEKEAFGLSLVEAMACGLPCVATPVGAMREIVDDGVTGTLVEPGDETALGAALEALVEGGPRMDAIGAAAERVAHERYAAASVVSAYEGLFARLGGPGS